MVTPQRVPGREVIAATGSDMFGIEQGTVATATSGTCTCIITYDAIYIMQLLRDSPGKHVAQTVQVLLVMAEK